jgi:hypothetical protein
MVFFFFFVLAHGLVFRPLWASDFSLINLRYFFTLFFAFYGETLFFAWPKKRAQKKGHPTVLAFGVSVRFSVERALWNSLRSDSPRAIPL